MSELTVVVVNQCNRKSVGLAVLLAFLFGPLGMLYSTIGGAIVMFLLGLVIGIPTGGIGLAFLWPLQLIWAGVAASRKNKNNSGVTVVN